MCVYIYNTLGLTVYSHQIDPSIWLNDFQAFSISGLLESSPARANMPNPGPPQFFFRIVYFWLHHIDSGSIMMNHDDLRA